MATLKISKYLTLVSNAGTITAKHGASADAITKLFERTVDGDFHYVSNSIANGTWDLIWDGEAATITTFDSLFFWSDEDMYIELFYNDAAASDQTGIFKVTGKDPFCLSTNKMVVNQADLSSTPALETLDTTEPTTVNVEKILVSNHSGDTANFVLLLVD